MSGVGKSTVGSAAATAAGVEFIDADDLHPRANIALMSAGTPLTDDDREPWLDAVADAAIAHAPCVIACSALARRYRQRLRDRVPGIRFVLLDVPDAELRRRLESRAGHFMSVAMLDSQLRQRENPDDDEDDVVVVDGTAPVAALAARVGALLRPRVD